MDDGDTRRCPAGRRPRQERTAGDDRRRHDGHSTSHQYRLLSSVFRLVQPDFRRRVDRVLGAAHRDRRLQSRRVDRVPWQVEVRCVGRAAPDRRGVLGAGQPLELRSAPTTPTHTTATRLPALPEVGEQPFELRSAPITTTPTTATRLPVLPEVGEKPFELRSAPTTATTARQPATGVNITPTDYYGSTVKHTFR